MAIEIARQALYDLVWSKAKTLVAKDLGISVRGQKKVASLRIPGHKAASLGPKTIR